VTSRATLAKPATLKVIDAASRRLGDILHIPFQALRSGETLDLFDRRAKEARIATEQAFRYARVAKHMRAGRSPRRRNQASAFRCSAVDGMVRGLVSQTAGPSLEGLPIGAGLVPWMLLTAHRSARSIDDLA
jgi:hypothetical protein